MADNTIESLSIALTGDASQLARDVEKAMQETIATMEASVEEIAAASSNAFALIPEELKQSVSDAIVQISLLGREVEESARDVADTYEVAMEDVVKSVEVAFTAIQALTDQQLQITKAVAFEGGVTFTPEEEESVRKQIELMVALGTAIGTTEEDLKALNDKIDQGREKMIDSVVQTRLVNESIQILKEGYQKLDQSIPIEKLDALIKRLQRVYETGKRLGTPLGEIRQNMLDIANEAIPQQTTQLGKLGQMLTGIAGKIIAVVGAYALLRKAGQLIKESVEQARIAVEETTRLTLAVREHQRAVGELSPTVAEANAQVEYLSDTYNLNRNATRKLISESMLLTESLGFTNDQTKKLQESSVILAEILDKDALGVMRQLTNFLNTGYTQGLRDLGFQLDDHTLRIEAIKRGYIDYGDVLDETTMRMVGMELIEERAAQAKDDLIKSQEALTGQLKDANVELETQQEILGKLLLPAWQKMKLFFTKILITAVQIASLAIMDLLIMINRAVARMKAVAEVAAILKEEGLAGISERGGFGRVYDTAYTEAIEDADEKTRKAIASMLGAGQELGDEFPEGLNKAGKAAEEFEDTIVAAMDGAVTAIEKLSRKYEQDLLKAQNRLSQQLEKIDDDFKRRREKMGLDLAHDLQDIERDSAERRLNTSRDFYNTEERERADHQLAMKRLEADYLMSLEDAVRERDARQVLSLRRKFAQDKKRANEDYSIARKRRREDFQLELAEIEQQRIIRRNRRITQFNEEIVQLAEQEELKRKQVRDAFNRRIEELNARYGEMLKLEAEKLAASLGLNAEHLSALAKMLDQAYGSNGFVVAYVNGISEWLSRQNLVLPTVGMTTGGSPMWSDVGINPYEAAGGAPITTTPIGVSRRQRAGTMFASSPTLFMAGEGPERIDFTRLAQPGGGPRGGGAGAGGPIEIALRVAMEDGLIAEITDQTMEGVAQVFVSIEGGGPRTAGRR